MKNPILAGLVAFQLALLASGCGSSDSSEAKPQTLATAATTTARNAVDWNYLKTEYADFFAAQCPTDSKDPQVDFCLSTQHQKLLAFQSDASNLPLSAERAELLQMIQEYISKYNDYENERCKIRQSPSVICIMQPVLLEQELELIRLHVQNNS